MKRPSIFFRKRLLKPLLMLAVFAQMEQMPAVQSPLFSQTPRVLSSGVSSGRSGENVLPHGREVVEVLDRNDDRGFVRYTGSVEGFDRNGLVLKMSDGTKTFEPHLVRRIHYRKSGEHQQADLHFRQKNHRDALALYKQALISAEKRWIEVEIRAQIIRCETSLGFHAQAVKDFAALTELEPEMPDPVFSCIPMAWQTLPGDLQIEKMAKELMRTHGKTPSMAVLCGSFLLFSPGGKDAVQKMKVFAEHKDPRISSLAQAQCWRLEMMEVSQEKAALWQEQLETFPLELRAGPSFLLGQAFLRLKNYDSAALAFLRTALVYREDPTLSREALRQAQKALELGGRPEEAAKLKTEN
ncbi:MAG: hypothetical protein E7029_00505 [Planctomycetaceae bacterium]|nr:hypothetical protein [Planctomycetaceae bacterium]